MKNKLSKKDYKEVSDVMGGIVYMAKRYGIEEDIKQTIDLTFLQCITRYERKESAKGPIPFSRISI